MKVFIIHVKTAYEREKRMLNILNNNKCLSNYEFVLDGDIDDLSEDLIKSYFSDNNLIKSQISCAYKHILACKKIVKEKLEYALILEDDIFLYKDFCSKLKTITNEIATDKLSNFIISLEESNLKYVKGSERKKDKVLYPKKRCRFTGALIIDYKAAKNILNELNENKTNLPIDLFFDSCSSKKIVNIFWSHPTLCIQGSINGSIKALIGNKRFGFKRRMSHEIQKAYKKMLYRFK